MEATSQEITRVDPIAALQEQSVYDTMDARQLAMLKTTRMRKLTDVEVGMALELCRTMGLNPWNDEIYATKGNDGELLIMVGRNGLLRKAEEFPDYKGYDSGVVYANDEFSKGEPDPDAKTLRGRAGVRHIQGHPKNRGEVVGAWAVAEREGRPPRYFFAPIEDYRPNNPHPKSSWARNPTVMIDKVPISVVHRTLTNLSGVYLREEIDKMLERTDGERVVITAEEEWEEIVALLDGLEISEELRERLRWAMAEMNTLSPASWNLAKVQMTLPGRSEEELTAQVEQIMRDIDEARERQERRAAREAEEENITDAVVVEDGVDLAVERARVEQQLEDARAALENAIITPEQAEELNERISGLLNELDGIEAAMEASGEPE